MFCKRCGRQIGDDSAFCSYCGEKIGVETPVQKDKKQPSSLSSLIGLGFAMYCFFAALANNSIATSSRVSTRKANEAGENMIIFVILGIVIAIVSINSWNKKKK